MIDRYSRPAMKNLWTEDAKIQAWAEVERAHLATLVSLDQCPEKIIEVFDRALNSKKQEDFERREQETGHDVIAFVAEVGEEMGPELSPFLHRGLTSSDVVDTSLACRVKASLELLLHTLQELRESLTLQAFAHAHTPCMGRTHGIHGEPLAFGQVLAGHFSEFQRAHHEVLRALKQISYGKLSGAVGTYSQVSPGFEAQTLKRLGLAPEPLATQVIPRDRLVVVGKAMTLLAGAVERLATNVRHWARTELGEVLEAFGKKQKGSSAMPHKRNPVLSENLCGLARTVRGYARTLEEDVALWHERDISHSSVERLVLPDLFVVTDFMLSRAASLVKNWEVRPEAMKANIAKTGGLWASQSVLTALVSHGLPRTEAYELVQKIAHQILPRVNIAAGVGANDFFQALRESSEVKQYLGEKSSEILAPLFSLEKYLSHTPILFERVFGTVPEAFERHTEQTLAQRVPALRRVVEVTVALLPDVLDTEARTIAYDMGHAGINTLDLRQKRVFRVSVEPTASLAEIQKYAQDVLHNAVIESVAVEVVG